MDGAVGATCINTYIKFFSYNQQRNRASLRQTIHVHLQLPVGTWRDCEVAQLT